MNVKKVTDANFLLFAAHHYDNPECYSDDEFYEDLNKFKYIKRIFRKYKKNNRIDRKSVHLALNHIILVINVFGPQAGAALLFYKLDEELYSILKPFLAFLHALPPQVNMINTKEVLSDKLVEDILKEF